MGEWRPEGAFEETLGAAYAAGDLAACLALLREAELALPIGPRAAAGHEPVAWPTMSGEARTWIVACTSAAAVRAVAGDATRSFRVVSLPELAAGWPDARWGLAVNPGLPVSLYLEPGTVARLAAPSPSEDRRAVPESGPPIMQKALDAAGLRDLLVDGGFRVSGYCHQAVDVAHIATPAVLADALGAEGTVGADGSVNLLRWRAAGLNLYRPPYGGADEESMAAVAGWVVEEPPFTGMGYVPNVDQVIREYKVSGVGLPHGAEVWELTASGVEHRRAVFDGDLARWLLVHVVAAGSPPPGTEPHGAEPPVVATSAGDPSRAEPSHGARQAWHSYRALFDGVEYEASPDPRADGLWMRLRSDRPAAGFVQVAPGRFVRPAPAEECEAVRFVTTVAEWRDAPCQVRGERDGELLLEYTGGLLPVARRLGLERVERGVHRRWVPRDEVRDLRDQVVDLDF
ncbi:hypothetical protein Skr01_04550 [Sphaerisporangium krabiense]|uniref:SseB protein N-terminal domain-containing protein n=1 Tax=Sphaerisporangium krabiense TaxID=763782 RepID=A0A7W8Z7A0_9ACTN|nr:SseB family protein [Sphaerisporangium krabiense]MBB5628788.1 hypothetical protein [Sphaerisporangium krabiense]GII60370.1 hypothetical protein Skr01_04550 [Sphaerisporangium krabiense]